MVVIRWSRVQLIQHRISPKCLLLQRVYEEAVEEIDNEEPPKKRQKKDEDHLNQNCKKTDDDNKTFSESKNKESETSESYCDSDCSSNADSSNSSNVENDSDNNDSSNYKKHFDEMVFETIIQRNVRLGEAPSYGESIISYDAGSTGANNYLNLAHELIQKNR